MKTTTKLAAFVFPVVLTAFGATATTESCTPHAEVTVDGATVHLPADVAERVRMLKDQGARYARAVKLIIAENMKPDWTFAHGCPAAAIDTSTTATPQPTPWFAALDLETEPATPGAARDLLITLFDSAAIRGAGPSLLGDWYSVAISDPMIPTAMHLAGETGIDAIIESLFDNDAVDQFASTLDMRSARPLFAVLFHPILLEALVDETDARRAAWSSMVNTLEGLYRREA